MKKTAFLYLAGCMIILAIFSACDKGSDVLKSDTDNNNDDTTNEVNRYSFKNTVKEAMAVNKDDHDKAKDYVWDSTTATQITFNGSTITSNGTGATVSGSTVTITTAGTYILSGALNDGQIIVNSVDEETVKLVLNGIDIYDPANAPLYVKNAKKTVIILADGSKNIIRDGSTYILEDPTVDEPNAAVYSKSDLSIYGNGSLTVYGNYNDGIASVDGIVIKSGNIIVRAQDDGIRGKDYLVIKDGILDVNAVGDGLKSDNADDTSRGYVLVENGTIAVIAGKDAITAQTDALIADGVITLTSGGGSSKTVSDDVSAKGIKAPVNSIIDNGAITFNCADDAIHSNGNLTINGGELVISTGDDAIHADSALTINNGDITAKKCYEGIESTYITVNGGNIRLTSSDDGVNAADGSGGGDPGGGMPGGGNTGGGGMPTTGNYYLYINGGYLAVNAAGDGFDINGTIVMTGGNVIVHGPTENMNGALDWDKGFKMTGGFLVAAGSAGMAQAPASTSTQYAILINMNKSLDGGTMFHIQAGDGSEILSFTPSKKYQSVAFSSDKLVNGGTYDVYYGGTCTGTAVDGLYSGGVYTAGTKLTSFTVSSMITKITVR
ncbi:MAG TPA: carbohydrate-binding domain-containing protein [bacterium]|nr:carbohydrate-binding domain-containing protein [bacterium]HPN43821.1 carbohydrate-binding domain-containing protein [bacterium]